MALSLWALSYVLEVAKEGSISKASQKLFLSQPHVSNTIRAVESELDVQIFRRTTKGMVLTGEGEVIVRKAQAILAQMNSLELMFNAAPQESLRLRLSTIRCYRIHECITNFINANASRPQVLFHLKETNPFQVVEDIRNNEADMGIVNIFDAQNDYFLNMFKANSIKYQFHYSRDFLLLISQNSPLAKQACITGDMLKSQIAVLYGDYETLAASYEVITESSQIVISRRRIFVYDRASAMETLGKCPNTYMWITGLHPDVLRREGLVMRRCQGVSAKNMGYSIYSSNGPPPALALDLQRQIAQINWEEDVG